MKIGHNSAWTYRLWALLLNKIGIGFAFEWHSYSINDPSYDETGRFRVGFFYYLNP